MDAGQAGVDDLALRFGVSKMTVHRDLDDLEESGFLRKVRGGASIQPSSLFESDFRYRQKQATEEKQRLAAAAVAMIEPGQTVIIDDGSTAGGIARHLADLRPLTVISNNLAVIQELAGAGGINLIALGGQYSKKFHGFFGLLAPAGTPPEIVARLNGAMRAALASEPVAKTFGNLGFTTVYSTPQQMAVRIAEGRATYDRIVKARQIRVD